MAEFQGTDLVGEDTAVGMGLGRGKRYRSELRPTAAGRLSLGPVCPQELEQQGSIYTKGCVGQFEKWLQDNLIVVAGVLVGIALLQVQPWLACPPPAQSPLLFLTHSLSYRYSASAWPRTS